MCQLFFLGGGGGGGGGMSKVNTTENVVQTERILYDMIAIPSMLQWHFYHDRIDCAMAICSHVGNRWIIPAFLYFTAFISSA